MKDVMIGDTGGISVSLSGTQARIFFAWTDADNHTYLEYERIDNSGGIITLYFVIGGVTTQSDGFYGNTDFYTLGEAQFRLCWNADEIVIGNVSPARNLRDVAAGRVGLGNGSTASQTATFTGLRVNPASNGIAVYEPSATPTNDTESSEYKCCPCCNYCDSVCEGDSPATIEVTFNSNTFINKSIYIPNSTTGMSNAGCPCDSFCDGTLLNTFVLTKLPFNQVPEPKATGCNLFAEVPCTYAYDLGVIDCDAGTTGEPFLPNNDAFQVNATIFAFIRESSTNSPSGFSRTNAACIPTATTRYRYLTVYLALRAVGCAGWESLTLGAITLDVFQYVLWQLEIGDACSGGFSVPYSGTYGNIGGQFRTPCDDSCDPDPAGGPYVLCVPRQNISQPAPAPITVTI